MDAIREPIVEGIFYPADGEKLRRLVEELFMQSEQPKADAFGLISPHAGFRYAGPLCATAFKSAALRPVRTVVILAPVHRDPIDSLFLPESHQFRTPLGLIPVNDLYVDELLACGNQIFKNDIPHLEEHCVEVQLPFIQCLFPQADIVPILVGKNDPKLMRMLSNALHVVFSQNWEQVLFVASANMTSYMQGHNAREEADLLLNLISRGAHEEIMRATADGRVSSFGAGCIAVLLSLRFASGRIQIQHRGSSAEINLNYNELVHYAAVSIFPQGDAHA